MARSILRSSSSSSVSDGGHEQIRHERDLIEVVEVVADAADESEVLVVVRGGVHDG
jgi:hypothetical protein